MFKQVLFMAIGLFMFSNGVSAEIKLVDGSENVVASNIEGAWSSDTKATERLQGKGTAEALSGLKSTFSEDKNVLDVLNSKENGKTLKYDVYSVGRITYTT